MNLTSHRPVPDRLPREWLVAGVALLCASHVALGATVTNRPAAKRQSDRYLLIVDTSASMERNAENTQRLVGQLMASGIVGQARAGDTIGLWTFNEELQTGSFPLQLWSPQARQRIATAASDFLKRQRYAKRSRFESVIEPLTSVVKDSRRITVLILTDGSEKISGTPFDGQINESHRLNFDEQRKQRMPFITVLRAKDGEFIGWRVNTLPFRPEFPAFPVEPEPEEPPAEIVEPKPQSEPEPRPTAPPLIVVGEPPPTVAAAPTNAAPVETPQPATTEKPVAPEPVAEPKPEVQPAQPVETPTTAVVTETPDAVKPVEPPKIEPPPPTASPTATPPPPEAASKPPVRESPAAQTDTPPSADTKPGESTVPLPPAVGSDVPETPVQTAVATPAESLFNRTNLLIAGAVLLVVAFAIIYVLMRRAARPDEKVSLITRSMDRDQK